ncbi:MAG: hypothetical protein ACYC63_18770 [Armatimonadota bacterium]
MNKLIMISLGLCLLLVAAVFAGCGGDDPAYVSRPTDVISGHWVLVQQAPVPAGARLAAAAPAEFSILYTAGGLPRWSGNLEDHEGVPFDPNQGEWSKENGTYTVTNSVGQSLQFVFVGSQLRSTTMRVQDAADSTSGTAAEPTPYYQWWSRT